MGLTERPIFKHIISIGFEFETHDISKLTMTGSSSFVVSNISMQGLKDRIKKHEAVKLDNHSYTFFNRNEYIDDHDSDGDDINPDIVMHTTVDFGENNFDHTLLPHCKDVAVPKNELYEVNIKNKTHSILFPEDLSDISWSPCSNFSGTEWIVTFYKPKSSASIILDSFVNACDRIFGQLESFEKMTGQFVVKSTKQLVGYKYRHIYHKPGTNLYFLQMADRTAIKNMFSLDKIKFVPQMTFCVNLVHAVDVMKEMITVNVTKKSRMSMELKQLEEEFIKVFNCVEQCFPMTKTELVKKAICLLGLIVYKVMVYVNHYASDKDPNNYFKDYITFTVRHSNTVLYKRLKEVLSEMNVSLQEVLDISILSTLYKKHKSAALRESTKHFGNPTKSFISYFEYLEQENEDWFEYSGISKFTSHYEFANDNLMIEHRDFAPFITVMMRDANLTVDNYSPSILSMKKFIDTLTIHDKMQYVYNKKTRRYVKKCSPGTKRNDHFVCKGI